MWFVQFNKMTKTVLVTAMSNHNWRGVPLSQLYGSDSPWGSPEFPLVRPGFNHAVLYHIPANGDMIERPPKPQIGHEQWDKDHVRLPCSRQSLYPVVDSKGNKHLRERWDIIVEALSKPIRNSQDLVNAILTYNTRFKDFWHFSAIHKLFGEYLEEEETQYFFDVTLPEIAKLALALPKLIQAPIPLLKQNKNKSVSLSQQQISSLLANAFFCTFPRRNSNKSDAEYGTYPHINFAPLFNYQPLDNVLEKIKCLCHYFRRVCAKVPTGVVTFTRRSVPRAECPDWARSTRAIAALPVHIDPDAIIEELDGLIQVDFANKYLGGGVLGGGCVQEEIRFVICPELLVSMLFTQSLQPTEAILVIGSERYSKYTGYGSSFHWAGDHVDPTPIDSSCRKRCAVLALDAMPFHGRAAEWKVNAVTRELNKAWVGFSFHTEGDSIQYPGVATGNWGCGAFGGSVTLKSVLQMMASAQATRPLAYCTFRDVELRDYMHWMYTMLCRYDVTVGQLYRLIVKYCETAKLNEIGLKTFLEKELKQESVCLSNSTKPEPMSINPTPESNSEPMSETYINKELKASPDMFEDDENDVKMLSLVAEMDQQDEDGLKLSHTNVSQIDRLDVSVDDKIDMEVSPDVKKKISKKITDYFAKKT